MKDGQSVNEIYLLSALRRGNIPHACIISGQDSDGQNKLALEAVRILCLGEESDTLELENCPDYISLSMPKIDRIRELILELAKRPFGDRWRTVLIFQADQMTVQAQNALLKTLEDPPERTAFILAGKISGLLPTIRSRCLHVFVPVKDKAVPSAECKAGPGRDINRIKEAGEKSGQFKQQENEPHREQTLDYVDSILTNRKVPLSKAEFLVKDKEQLEFKLEIMLSYFRDLLRIKECGVYGIENVDRLQMLAGYSESFTTKAINGIIDLLLEAIIRLKGNANPSMLIDSLMVGVSEVL